MYKTITKAVLALLLSSTLAFAHDGERPTEHKGVSVSDRNALELGAQIPAMEGFQVRIRTVTVEPGGIVAAHDHSTRPGAYFVVRGDGINEYRADGTKVLVPAGTAVLEGREVDHWIVNEGGEAVFFVFDIVPVE
ncbi:Cupin domain protein [Epibacterium ulvae]|uniref:Cupin domain protein n=1 Tax=Epibacterium ulvae TaxID=1156985 RepID=A0A1G5QKH6_9RHOB|nr:cupin domain-containing protein [Epibacterium ulvae]SCZ62118.1 Cupin domain protein [Epibacterium ulvae]